MSTIKQGILGPFSGKVGTVIGGSWNGIAYMRGIAPSVSNPRTPAQLNQRAKFAETLRFLQPLTSFLRIGFKDQAVRMSAFNAAMSYTIKNALTGTYPDYSIDYTRALVCRGPLTGVLNGDATSSVAAKVDFTWDDNSLQEANALPNDKVVLLVYNPLRNQAVSLVGGKTRAEGSDSVTLPELFSGETVECYIAFISDNESVVSDSQWVGSILVA